MTFLIYKIVNDRGEIRLRPTQTTLGENDYKLPWLLQKAWEIKGRPVNLGWEVSADELIRIHTGGNESYQTRRLLSNFHPSSKTRIGMIELLHVYLFTWGDVEGNPSWTPFMLKGRDVLYEEYEKLSESDKKEAVADLPEFDQNGQEFAEFLYCNVNKNGNWIWGLTGRANAAFLQGKARAFFKQFL